MKPYFRMFSRDSLIKRNAVTVKGTRLTKPLSIELVFGTIHHRMLRDQLYLEKDLDIKRLSDLVNIKPKTISKAIQGELNVSFNTYVNNLRINKAKDLLRSNRFKHYSMHGIGMACGYSSKSTFYRNFTKVTGVPPAEYSGVITRR